MRQTEEQIIQRLDQLIQKGLEARNHYVPGPPGAIGASHIDYAFFNEWKNNSENLIIGVAGENSHYYKNFVNEVKDPWDERYVESGIGILRALKNDIEGGFLTNVRELILAELFKDFLEMASHLLDAGYKDPAASLIGAILEDGLRKIAVKHGVRVKDSDDIAALNTKLADKEIYSRLLQKQIQFWKSVRDSADHGKFDEYKKEDVRDMLKGVQRFLTENL